MVGKGMVNGARNRSAYRLREDYFRSIHELAEMGAKEIWSADDPETIRAVLSVIAIAKGLRSEDEVSALEPR
jgi:hypothetical protein